MEIHPLQVKYIPYGKARINSLVTARCFEVYHYLFPGQTFERLTERGGFGASEIIGFLYAFPFPQAEWKARFAEATEGLEGV